MKSHECGRIRIHTLGRRVPYKQRNMHHESKRGDANRFTGQSFWKFRLSGFLAIFYFLGPNNPLQKQKHYLSQRQFESEPHEAF